MGLAGFMLAEEMAKRKRYELPAEFDNDEICTKQGPSGKKKYAVGDNRKTARFPSSPKKKAKLEALQVEKFNPYKATKAELRAFLTENEIDCDGPIAKSVLVSMASDVLVNEDAPAEKEQ